MRHLFSTLLYIVVHPNRFTIMWEVSPQSPPVCSIHLDDAMAAQNNGASVLTTHQLGGERRERDRANQVYALTHQYRWREREREIGQSSVCSHHTPATGERRERERDRDNQVYAPHTPATGGEERER